MKKVKTRSSKEPSQFSAEFSNGVVTRIESCFDIVSSVEMKKDAKTGEEKEETVFEYTFAFDNKLIRSREKLISSLIRLRYSVDDEIALNRQRDTKQEDWNAYNLFAEEAKNFANKVFANSNS